MPSEMDKWNEIVLGKKKTTVRVPKKILRRMVWKRDKGVCQLCHTKLRAGEDWDLSRNRAGQPYTYRNCFVAHHTCNISQGRATKGQTKKALGYKKKPKKTTKKTAKSKEDSFVNTVIGKGFWK